jgi:hypothetical protein
MSQQEAELIPMTRRKDGATLDAIVSATGWQKHTVRGIASILGSERRAEDRVKERDGDLTDYEVAPTLRPPRRSNSAAAFPLAALLGIGETSINESFMSLTRDPRRWNNTKLIGYRHAATSPFPRLQILCLGNGLPACPVPEMWKGKSDLGVCRSRPKNGGNQDDVWLWQLTSLEALPSLLWFSAKAYAT